VRRRSLPVAVLLAVALGLSACTSESVPDTAAPVAVTSSSPTATPSPTQTPIAVAAAAAPTPTATVTPPPTQPPKPAFSYDVAAAQRTLTDLRYYVGPADGKPGAAMRNAVMAFQKVQGLPADGVVGPATLAALANPTRPALKATAPASRVEVDLTKQVLYVVKGGEIARIMPVSSGNGASYKQKNGVKARSLTPVGWYKIERRIVGVREADLGTLYDPQYFYRGWAIHGSNSVPAYPASHGCIRVPRPDAKWLLNEISVGMSVYLYGGTHVFTAGSSAPGTDNPTGDTAASAPAPEQQPTPAPQPEPTSPSPTPSQTASPSPSPTPSETASPSPSATATPSESASAAP
jgi:lipoprotein-anchoring transpeptidase ErfK/SrfK